MAQYSFFAIPSSDVTVSGTREINGNIENKTLSGLNQGDGSHLIGETVTINAITPIEIFVDDNGSETNFADNDGGQTLDADVVVGTETYTTGTRVEAEYQFVLRDPATGIEYRLITINFNTTNPSFGTVEALGFVDAVPPQGVTLTVVSASEGPSNGGPNAIDEDQIVICFAKGTHIATVGGLRRVEDLCAGDYVLRPDQSSAPLRRIFQSEVPQSVLHQFPKLYPVKISKGALGQGLPHNDLWVSRQHRMLLNSPIAARMFGTREVLVPAIKLTSLPGIYVDETQTMVSYFHLLFDRHEIITAEGAPSESLFTGPEALKALGPDERAELLTLFPDIATQSPLPEPACLIPSGARQKQLIAQHLNTQQPLICE